MMRQSKQIVSYLASGQFPGIGYKTALKIVEVFGDITLNAIDANPEILREYVRQKKDDCIRAYCKARDSGLRNAYALLLGSGVSTTNVRSLYSDSRMAVWRSNRLC